MAKELRISDAILGLQVFIGMALKPKNPSRLSFLTYVYICRCLICYLVPYLCTQIR